MAFKAFDRHVSFKPGTADTKWVEAELARFAKEELAAVLRTGEASPVYVRAVNGRTNVPEEAVKAPGAIVYSFDWLRDAAAFAEAWLRRAAPVKSGRYRRSFIVVADGREIPAEAVTHARAVQVVNTQPYSRKIQVGSKGFEARRGLFDQAARRVRAEFRGLVKARGVFVHLSDGYRLKRDDGRRGGGAYARAHYRQGSELTYPAIELTSETVAVN